MSIKNLQCNSDPKYNFHECIESYFYKLRGCQYPWNVYSKLNLPICTNFTEVKYMIESYDRNMGKRREWFTPSEQIIRTNGECLPPCQNTIYDIKLEKWNMFGDGRSFQIAFADFAFRSASEYVACGWTCVVGELGGNLGFFLGGSIIFGIDLVIEYIGRLIKALQIRLAS